ncbi:DNA-directed RNA polymerase III subunit RPC1 [Plasmodium inui San Antonio 1]|uniref:DNA-directed RNA polymerase subunit n=1 Tax=Plasmodium inui San Antonio 1 TaxID=1237626 RepID=W7A300_9APIC|nr:DNA-directed RNA polymerase III subunit RPC1 [Plasmodium inui San Antonio 1]EUD67602.1 DNA-directed RNA polymerase III subunit RPC1 [Plasmodium inui San Antonio 1]
MRGRAVNAVDMDQFRGNAMSATNVEKFRGNAANVEELRRIIQRSSLRKGFVQDVKNNWEIKSLKFGIMNKEEIIKCSEVKILNREMYKNNTGIPYPYGVLDLKLGAHKSNSLCETCNRNFMNCSGHFGYIELNYPLFHVGYYKYIIYILYCICKVCSHILLSSEKLEFYTNLKRHTVEDKFFKKHIFKKILNTCKKVTKCYRCGYPQGVIKKIIKPSLDQFMKLKHVIKTKENGKMVIKEDDLNSLYVLNLFKNMNPYHVKLLNVENPEKLLITALLVPPNTIRPSVIIDEHGTAEDDLTCILSEITQLNNTINNQCSNGYQTNQFLGNVEFLQLQITRFINSDSPAVSQLLATQNISKPGRGICQRLKGKEGRFRCNLSGKRVDFSSRTVISPDPNISIDEVVIPEIIAMRLTYPEKVNRYNIERLKRLLKNGTNRWPGANYIIKKGTNPRSYYSTLGGVSSLEADSILDVVKRYVGRGDYSPASGQSIFTAQLGNPRIENPVINKISLKYANKKFVIENLQVGDIVERHLMDGDIVLFNRQPSLHRMSIMCHKARVMKYKTFRFNVCVCSPYNADFDGDEMNLHVPQTEEARAEASYLMNVKHNLITPKNGEVMIALTQDFLSASYVITNKDTFLDRDSFCLLCSYFSDAKVDIELPVPAILKPKELWTGKQLITVLIKPNRKENTIINFEMKEREYSTKNGDLKHMCLNDSYVCFYKSELICGSLGKKVLGSSKYGLFYYLIHHNSSYVALKIMNRFSKLTSRYFSNKGMTIGIDDVAPSETLLQKKKDLLQEGYEKVNKEILLYNEKKMQIQAGCTLEETLEIKVKNILDDLRNDAGKTCNQYLDHLNKPLVMFNSGAKGALINIAQMIACVGQQNVTGQRIQNGFINRTLPHFNFHCKDSESRGFVENSFYTGLNPTEFFFHTMSGREGLVDTAVKTAETGYMQRRLMKALEDLSIHYDYSVRSCDKQIVQFIYGDDALNPSYIDNNNSYAHQFDKIFDHITSISSSNILLSYGKSLPDSSRMAAFPTLPSLSSFTASPISRIVNRVTSKMSAPDTAPFIPLSHDEHFVRLVMEKPQRNPRRGTQGGEAAEGEEVAAEVAAEVTAEADGDEEDAAHGGGPPGGKPRHGPSAALEGRVKVEIRVSACVAKEEQTKQRKERNERKEPKRSKQRTEPIQPKGHHPEDAPDDDPDEEATAQNNCVLPPHKHHSIARFVNDYRNVVEIKTLMDKNQICLSESEKKLVRSMYSQMSKNVVKKIQIVNTVYRSEREKSASSKEQRHGGTSQTNVRHALSEDTTTAYAQGYLPNIRKRRHAQPHIGTSGSRHTDELARLYESKLYRQMIKNVIAFVSVFQYIEKKKQHYILLPYEIVQWTNFLLNYLPELMPTNIYVHTKLSQRESPTHQERTKTMNIYMKEIKKWLIVKAINVYKFFKYKKGVHLMTRSDYFDFVCRETYDPSYRYLLYDYPFVNLNQLYLFIFFNVSKYFKYISAPGDAVGSISAQSIGEPGTQMTLKTFHFAGVASMNVTLGVPRIKEIINASSTIQTPILNIPLQVNDNYNFALMMKSKLEKTTIRDICLYIKEDYTTRGIFLSVKFNEQLIHELFLNINAYSIKDIIMRQSHINKIKINKILVEVVNTYKLHMSLKNDEFLFFQIESLKKGLLDVLIHGDKDIKRCIIKKEEVEVEVAGEEVDVTGEQMEVTGEEVDGVDEPQRGRPHGKPPPIAHGDNDDHTKGGEASAKECPGQRSPNEAKLRNIMEAFKIQIKEEVSKRDNQAGGEEEEPTVNLDTINVDTLNLEYGNSLNYVLGLEGVDFKHIISNHVINVFQVLGIEAARVTIINEIKKCIEAYSIDIDIRHIMLLADIMAFTGDILGINRFGIQKARQSTLMLASFEETNEHLFVSSFFKNRDEINNISESIIVGKNIPIGTGAFQLLYDYKL